MACYDRSFSETRMMQMTYVSVKQHLADLGGIVRHDGHRDADQVADAPLYMPARLRVQQATFEMIP